MTTTMTTTTRTRPAARATLLLAAALGAATVATVTSTATATAPSASVFVPITPCRLADTRAGTTNVGPRSTPLGAGEVMTLDTWGTNGNCTIPSGATGLSMNVVSIEPTASSFLTVFPADQVRPTASSLNWVAGQAPTPNSVTAAVSASGQLSFYNLAGTVQLAVDVVGYFAPPAVATAGPVGSAGSQGDPGPAGAGRPKPAHEVWVAESGADFTSISDALDSITDASPTNPYVVRVAPGVYDEPSGVRMKDGVDVVGSGTGTIVTSMNMSSAFEFEQVTAAVRDLAVEASGVTGIRILNGPGGDEIVTLSGVDVHASGGSRGITINYGELRLDDVDVLVESALPHAQGIAVTVAMVSGRDVDIETTTSVAGSGLGDCVALLIEAGVADLDRVSAVAHDCADGATAVQLHHADGTVISGATLRATSAAAASGLVVDASTVSADHLDVTASGGTTGYGTTIVNSGFLTLSDSKLEASTFGGHLVFGDAKVIDTVFVSPAEGLGGKCVNAMDSFLDPYTCPVSLAEA